MVGRTMANPDRGQTITGGERPGALDMAAGDNSGRSGGGINEQAMLAQLPPEMVEQIKQAYQVGANVLYDKQVFAGVVQGVDTKDPVRVLAMVLLKIVDGIDQKLGGLDVNVLLAVMLLLLGDVVDALQQTGRGPFTSAQVEGAIALMIKEWLSAHPDRVSPEELQALVRSGGAGGMAEPREDNRVE